MISPIVLQRMENCLVDFRYVALSNDEENELPPAKFHYDLSDLLLKNKDNVAVEMFRESGKSSYALRTYPLHCLCYPKRNSDYIVIIKQNQRLATNKLKELVEEYKLNPLLRHNLVCIKEENSLVFSADVKNAEGEIISVRIEAYGKGGSIRGLSHQDRRPNVIILDDIQDKEDSRSAVVVESDWEWFLSDIKFLGKKARIFLIGNNLGERCVIERVITNKDELNFTGIRIPVMVDGKSTWPEKESVKEIEAEKASFAKLGKLEVWYAEKMCTAVGEEFRTFNEDDYRYYSPDIIPELKKECKIFASLDPASSNKPDSCLRAIVVNGVKDNNWNILEVKYGRWDSSETLDLIFETVEQYGLKHFGIEKGHYQQVLEPFLLKEMKERNIFFEVIPLEHAKQGNKLERIKMLQPRFKSHSIWFPKDAEWLAELKSELAGVTKDAIKSMFIDCVDALAMQEQMTANSFNYLFETSKLEASKNIQASNTMFTPMSVMSFTTKSGKGNVAKLIKAIDANKFAEVETQEWESFDDDVSLGKITSLYSRWKPDIVIGNSEAHGLRNCLAVENTFKNFIKFNGASKEVKKANVVNLKADGYLCLKEFIDNSFLKIEDMTALTQLEYVKSDTSNGKVCIEDGENDNNAYALMMGIYALTYNAYLAISSDNNVCVDIPDDYNPFDD